MSKDYSQMASLESLNATQSALEEHGFKVLVVETLADAKAAVLNAIPAQAEVFTATSVTLVSTPSGGGLNGSARQVYGDETPGICFSIYGWQCARRH
jgi:hypothetical protein